MASELASCDSDWQAELRFLSAPSSYPSSPAAIEVIETTMSLVFLTEDEAYKIKKRLLYEGIDFTLADVRLHNAEEEVRLNRRFAYDVYLGVVPLAFRPGRGLSLGGPGRPVDWLVRMRRLPASSMLDTAIRDRRLSRQDMERVAEVLAAFLTVAPPIGLDPERYLERLCGEIARSVEEIGLLGSPDLRDSVGSVGARFARFIAEQAGLLGARASRLIDAHGDLRPEHVCLSQPLAIIDCLEFSAELRRRDPVDELAYLGMECARLGAPYVGPILLAAYSAASDDRPNPALLAFYRGFRALIRARIAIAHLRSNGRHPSETCLAHARSYLSVASLEIAFAERDVDIINR